MADEEPIIYFMPWADIEKSLNIGQVSFWSYSNEAAQHINDAKVREYLDEYFSHFVDHRGNPRNWITVCSYGGNPYKVLNKTEMKEIRNAVDVLAFVEIAPRIKWAVCANNKSMGPPSADVFELYSRAVNLESPIIFIQTRNRFEVFFNTKGLIIAQPYSVGPFSWTFDERLIEGFNGVFLHDEKVPILRSLEWFRLAHGALGPSWQTSPLTILTLMSTAIEILLQLPRHNKKKCFVEDVEAAISHGGFKQGERSLEGKQRKLSSAGCWAWDFYELRSRIVHGDVVHTDELVIRDWVSHLEVADLVFYELVLWKLFRMGCIGEETIRNAALWDKVVVDSEEKMPLEPVFRSVYGLNDIHKALDWTE